MSGMGRCGKLLRIRLVGAELLLFFFFAADLDLIALALAHSRSMVQLLVYEKREDWTSTALGETDLERILSQQPECSDMHNNT